MDGGRPQKFKTIGIYLILVLGLLRFLVYPLYGALEREKKVYEAQRESYLLKTRLLDRQYQNTVLQGAAVKKADLAPYLYEKTQSLMQIQLEIVQSMSLLAKEQGGELDRFEILETLPGKNLGEAPVIVWFSGQPKALMNILRAVENSRKALFIKSMEISKGAKDHVLSLTLSAYRLER